MNVAASPWNLNPTSCLSRFHAVSHSVKHRDRGVVMSIWMCCTDTERHWTPPPALPFSTLLPPISLIYSSWPFLLCLFNSLLIFHVCLTLFSPIYSFSSFLQWQTSMQSLWCWQSTILLTCYLKFVFHFTVCEAQVQVQVHYKEWKGLLIYRLHHYYYYV